jgi:hypothetical protein
VGTGFWRAPEVHANMYYVYYMSIAVNSAEHFMLKKLEKTGEHRTEAVTESKTTTHNAIEEHN